MSHAKLQLPVGNGVCSAVPRLGSPKKVPSPRARLLIMIMVATAIRALFARAARRGTLVVVVLSVRSSSSLSLSSEAPGSGLPSLSLLSTMEGGSSSVSLLVSLSGLSPWLLQLSFLLLVVSLLFLLLLVSLLFLLLLVSLLFLLSHVVVGC